MTAFVGLCLLLAAGHLLRMRSKLLQNLYLPSCVVGGLLGLLLVQGIGALAPSTADNSLISQLNNVLSDWAGIWGELPGLLINVVFACLFLGVKLPKFSTICRHAGKQLTYGQIVAWGQYVVPLGLWMLFLGKRFVHLPAMFAAILPIGFEGGHGTAAGMAETFEHHGWAAGKDFGLTSATFGVISAIVVGMILVNWAVRRGYVKHRQSPAEVGEDGSIGIIAIGRRPSAGKLTVNSDVIETFSLHIVIVGIAVGLGYCAKQILVGIENLVPYLAEHKLLSGFPLFPLCLFGGLGVQLFADKFDRHDHIDLGLIRRIQNASLDFLVIAAISTIQLKVVLGGMVPLIILATAGVLWNIFCVVFLSRKIFRQAWFERAIAEMGQSMGVTATGLLLLRVVDPDCKTAAANAFACKQLLHEPIMGGGLWTAMAVPLIAVYGPQKVFLIAASALLFWLIIAFIPKFIRPVQS